MSKSAIRTNTEGSREQIEKIIRKFLDNDHKNYRVLALKGEWGVGKTHLVQNILPSYQKESHYYASVFGISSIEQLKVRILTNYKNDININIQDSQIRNERLMNYIRKPIAGISEFFKRTSGTIEKTPKLDMNLLGISIPLAGSIKIWLIYMKIAVILVTHNTREFCRVNGL